MKKIVSLILALILIASIAVPVSGAEGTKFDIAGSGSDFVKEQISMTEGDTIGVQFKTTAKVKSFGLKFSKPSKDRAVTYKLYKWNKNESESRKGQELFGKTFTDWAKNEVVALDFGNGIEAGEYLVVVSLDEGSDLGITLMKPAAHYIRTYVSGYYVYGAPIGVIESVSPADDIFAPTTEPVGMEKHKAPAESVISKDSAIAKMGIDPTQWTAVDSVGRTLTEYSAAGEKKDKKVGIFYWTWHLEQSTGNKPINVNAIMEEYPESKNDYNHEIWKKNPACGYFWNEPLFGYYIESDDYVLRKHAELLADAGVDFVAFDCTNGDYTWESAYMNLLKVWDEARKDGVKTPQVAFMLPFTQGNDTVSSLNQIYDALYRKGLYQDLWFYLDGKPLVIGYDSNLSPDNQKQAEIADFFTFRYGDAAYMNTEMPNKYWGWLSCYPQARYTKPDGSVEQITVGVAQNANYEWCYDENGNKTGRNPCSAMNGPKNMGRSWTHDKNYKITYDYCGKQVVLDNTVENSKIYGFNFQEQWDFAISQDPEVIFVTGWNEWIAGRNKEWGGVANGFPDQCNDENSRDIEPTKGELKDNYYIQLCDNIRKFKGMNVPPAQTEAKKIDIAGDISCWKDSAIVCYNDYTHDTLARNEKGWPGTRYTAEATRNDFVTAKVSYDSDNVYFYVETLNPITARTDSSWMRLLIDTVSSKESDDGFEGFEFIVNREGATDKEVTVERFKNGWNFEKVGNAKYTVKENIMQIAVPLSYFGFEAGKAIKFNFKWCDNNLSEGDIMTLYTEGDTAPSGRYAYMFSTVQTPKQKKKGCGSTINFALSIPALMVIAFISLKKRRHDTKI